MVSYKLTTSRACSCFDRMLSWCTHTHRQCTLCNANLTKLFTRCMMCVCVMYSTVRKWTNERTPHTKRNALRFKVKWTVPHTHHHSWTLSASSEASQIYLVNTRVGRIVLCNVFAVLIMTDYISDSRASVANWLMIVAQITFRVDTSYFYPGALTQIHGLDFEHTKRQHRSLWIRATHIRVYAHDTFSLGICQARP